MLHLSEILDPDLWDGNFRHLLASCSNDAEHLQLYYIKEQVFRAKSCLFNMQQTTDMPCGPWHNIWDTKTTGLRCQYDFENRSVGILHHVKFLANVSYLPFIGVIKPSISHWNSCTDVSTSLIRSLTKCLDCTPMVLVTCVVWMQHSTDISFGTLNRFFS